MKKVSDARATVTIRRPNGAEETVDASKYGNMCQALADKISDATNKAGKGVVIAWTYTPAVYEKTAEEIAADNKAANEIEEYDNSRAKVLAALNA